MYRRMGKIEQAVTELSSLLDTFYTDVDGWLELADIYNSCQQYVSFAVIFPDFRLILMSGTLMLSNLSRTLFSLPHKTHSTSSNLRKQLISPQTSHFHSRHIFK